LTDVIVVEWITLVVVATDVVVTGLVIGMYAEMSV
jgi:hypothetical protein